MDRILICDLQVRCIVGLRDEERREKQDVIINLVLFADLAQACRSDRVEDTVDYTALKKRILAMVEKSSYFLAEALAEEIARICLAEPKIRKVRVQVEKPSALRFARSVGVRILRKREARPLSRAFVAVGSNIEPAHNVREAIRRLAGCESVTAVSTVYLSPAVGRPEQSEERPERLGKWPDQAGKQPDQAGKRPDQAGERSDRPPFYNCVVELATATAPVDLKLSVLRRIEAELGRQRSADKYAPRTIDLDLIAYGDLAVVTADLTLPDPQIAERPFLAVPLSELAPDLVLPGTGRTARDLAEALSQRPLEPLHAYTQLLRETVRPPGPPVLGCAAATVGATIPTSRARHRPDTSEEKRTPE
jgi:2-amino-4-hydroxy-6-hydroxymethyldihydropteridine diphosphokinase